MAGQSESVLIKSLLNDRLTKIVKHEGLDLLLEFSAIIFDSEFALSGDSFGMCEVSDYAIADMTNAAKVVMMAADPVYMSFAHSKYDITHNKYSLFFDGDEYCIIQERECPQFFKDLALAMKQNAQLLSELSTYLATCKTPSTLGSKLKAATLTV